MFKQSVSGTKGAKEETDGLSRLYVYFERFIHIIHNIATVTLSPLKHIGHSIVRNISFNIRILYFCPQSFWLSCDSSLEQGSLPSALLTNCFFIKKNPTRCKNVSKIFFIPYLYKA
jgi:hypothetical protein